MQTDLQSTSALMRRQISSLLTMSYSIMKLCCYKKGKVATPEKINFIVQRGHNTVIIAMKE